MTKSEFVEFIIGFCGNNADCVVFWGLWNLLRKAAEAAIAASSVGVI